MSESRSGFAAWRETLLTRVGYASIAVFIGAMAFSLIVRRPTGMLFFGVILGIGYVLQQLLSRSGSSYRLRASFFVATTVIASGYFYWFAGMQAGPIMAAAFTIVLASMLLGRTAFLGVVAVMVTGLFVMWATISSGFWEGPTPQIAELPVTDRWFRSTIVTGVFWLGMGYAVLFVVAAVESNVARLNEEAEQRREAQKRRREAEAAAAQSQKLEALGQLSAGIAHDFNNALLVLRGWNDILQEDDSAETREQAIAAIGQAIDQSEQLTNQLLTFGRSQMRSPRYLSIHEVVERTVDTLRRLFPTRVDLDVDIHDAGYVFADESQIQQMIFNLVINARDALLDGGRIDVRCRRADDADVEDFDAANSDDWVLIEVEDNGVGMDEDTRQRIFEPFFTTKEKGKGTGLGLATVFGIVQQSDASIDVVSEPGKGTCFRMLFPSVEVAPESESEPRRPQARIARTGRVFVLEDDPLARELLIFALKHAGFDTVEASNGDEALSLIKRDNQTFDLLSADAVFPGAGLEEVIAAFELYNPHGRVLICSGYIPDDIPLPGLESGLYEYLPKPFTADRLVKRITSMLARSAN